MKCTVCGGDGWIGALGPSPCPECKNTGEQEVGLKQVIVIRKDLNMRKGKMVAQGAHASIAAIMQGSFKHHLFDEMVECICIPLTPDIKSWLEEHFTKITAGVDSEAELIDLYEKAKAAGIRAQLITDSGHTEFKMVPTKTALAIGPDEISKIDKITGHLKLI